MRFNTGKWVAGSLITLGVLGMVFTGVQELRRMKHLTQGTLAAPFTLERWSGGPLTLGELRGKVVMIDFWATWCPPCVEEMPTLVRLAREYEGRGLVFIAASRDEALTWKADVSVFSDKRSPELTQFAAYADDTVGDAYNVHVLPTLYFIDRSGKVHEAHSGYADEAELRSLIEDALKGGT